MAEYRVCLNSAPHSKDWWTVEKSRRTWWGGTEWGTVQRYLGGLCSIDRSFKTEDEARAWVVEDKRPRAHTCKPA